MTTLLFLLYVTTVYGAMHGDLARLHRHLMTNYSTELRPSLNLSEPTKVNFGFMLLSLKEFVEKTSKFSIVGVFIITWHDFQLEWNPEYFGGIDSTLLSQSTVWKPDLLLMNPFERVESPGFDKLKVLVSNEGYVSWGPTDVYEIVCPVDVTYYPFDEQKCLFYFRIYMTTLRDVFLETLSSEIDLDHYYPNSLWELKSTNINVITNKLNISQYLILTVILKRRPMFQVINTIVPFCVLGLLNIMVFLLPVESGERVGFSVTVLLAIAVFMTIVADTLPGTSEPSFPRLCYMLVAELGTNALVTICTILLLRLHHKPLHQKIPSWLFYMTCNEVCINVRSSTECKHNTSDTVVHVSSGLASDINEATTTPTVNGINQSEDTRTKKPEIDNHHMTSWQDVAKFLDIVFFILFIVIFAASKIVAYFVFSGRQ
ncbi:acetylcholine receptor subunit beta-like [Argopecten irradians]|uniref:acetylcholine receptor subunit beta-like n=1 Tax=Argopecten irradians TaxID=31199 RepID=UPI00371672EA